MDYCANCGCDISELGSNRCIGFACANRLCFKCFSDTGGYCPSCKIQWELDGIRGNVGKYDNSDELYEELAGMPQREAHLEEEVRKRREKEEEERIKKEEEEKVNKKQKKDMWWFDFIDQEEEDEEEEE